MCNFQSNVDAFGVLLVDANTSVGLVSSDTSGSGNSSNCTVTTTTTTTTTTMTTTSSTTTSSITSYNVVDSPTMCHALNSSSDGATISGSPPGLMCNGMVMVGWLPDLWASLGEEKATSTSSNTTTTNSASSSTWGLTNTKVILPSIPLAFLIMIEHMINVNLYAGLIHDHPSVDNNLELFALGTTNIVASLFSSFGKCMRCVCATLEFVCVLFVLIRHSLLFCLFFVAATGHGFSRTSLNYKSGAKSQMSSVLSSVVTLLMILGLRSIIQFLPKLVLSIMILFAVAGLIDVKTFIRYYHVSKWDCATCGVTLIMTLFLGK